MYRISKNPLLLDQISQPPEHLFSVGELKHSRCVAIVGARKATKGGLEIARLLAETIAGYGITIVSGLARGIDSAAHQGALDASGKTIAVLPSGIEYIYPTTNAWLAKQIVENNGALVSEHKGDYRPRNEDFLARNRIIAGLSELTVVVEAGARSGALNTARHALEANREVMAVPGSILNPLAAGTNQLIKAGAAPLTRVEDALEILGIEAKADDVVSSKPKFQSLLDLFDRPVKSFDEIQNTSKLPLSELQTRLTEMELNGLISRLPGNLIRINKNV